MRPISWLLLLLPLLCFQATSAVAQETETDVSKFMRHLDVIPDVIDAGPQEFLNVTYAGNIQAEKGVQLQPQQVREQPVVYWSPHFENLYTLLMTDPDVPTRKEPVLKEYLHWLVVNVPGNQVSMGEERVPYVGSMPAESSGLHRYVFLLYKQPQMLKIEEPKLAKNSTKEREKFSTKEFVARYKLGKPLAGNFYTAAWTSDMANSYKSIAQGHS